MSNGRAPLPVPLLTPLLAVLLALGVVGMHGLSAGAVVDAAPAMAVGQHAPHAQQAGQAGQAQRVSECGHRDDPSHAHPGPVCRSAAVPTAPSVGSTSTAAVLGVVAVPARVSPATVAEQAARGNGRGPPSLDELSISRT